MESNSRDWSKPQALESADMRIAAVFRKHKTNVRTVLMCREEVDWLDDSENAEVSTGHSETKIPSIGGRLLGTHLYSDMLVVSVGRKGEGAVEDLYKTLGQTENEKAGEEISQYFKKRDKQQE